MSHSGPTETWGDGVIVVTLIYWRLSIHPTAQVSIFGQMNREMKLWPLVDCLNPSLHVKSLLHTPIRQPLSLLFPLSLPIMRHFYPSSTFALRQTLYSASLCGETQSSKNPAWHNAEDLASLWDSEQITWRNLSQLDRSSAAQCDLMVISRHLYGE